MRALKLATAAVIAAAVPLTMGSAAASAGPAAKARPKVELKVRVIDRNGAVVAPLDLQILNMRTMLGADLGTRTSRSVPPGRYNIAAWITTGTAPKQSYTLADRVVDLTRGRTIMLDARPGKLVRVDLNAPSAHEEMLEIAPVFRSHDWAFNPTTVENVPAHDTYVVPDAVKGMTFDVYSIWEKKGNTASNPSPFRYDIVNVVRGGIPARPVFRVRRSSLARVDVTVRATDRDQQADLWLSPWRRQILPFNATTTLGPTPARLISYRTPGYEWQPIVNFSSPYGDIQDNNLNAPADRKGRHSETYGSAVLAPNENDIFTNVSGRQLQVGQSQFPIQDPLSPTDEGSGVTQEMRLYSGGRLLGHSAGGNLNVRIPWARHWYTLRLGVSRKSGATLSTKITGVWRFPASGVPKIQGGGSPPVYEVRMLPAGLNLRNQAAPRATTRVNLDVFSPSSVSPVLLPVVRGYASGDDGARWTRVTARVAGDHYQLIVHDPRSAGFVSLRIYVRDSGGVSEKMTVIHAYAVR